MIEELVAKHGDASWEGVYLEPEEPPITPESAMFYSILDEVRDMHNRKQADYGRDDDPFANIRASEDFGIQGWLGSIMRANDKMSRLKTFAMKGNLMNEPVEDSLLDLAVYTMIALAMWRLDKAEQKKKCNHICG